MLIGRLISDNPRLAQAAVRAHQEGRLLSGTYLIDIDALAANAAMLRDAAAAAGLTVYFMAKQFGRNPDACRAAVGAGLDRAVAVDPQCLEAEVRHGIRIGHAGHLVQPHRGGERAVIDARPDVVTVFAPDIAARIGAAAAAQGRVQDVLLRVRAPGDTFYFGHAGGFPLDEVVEAAVAVNRIEGVRVAGVTTFPCLLADPALRQVVPTPNFGTLAKAADALRGAGFEITQVNAPGTTSARTMEALAAGGATHVEPGNALHGTTPLWGILMFIGFESAGTLGEEARNPRRTVPIALFTGVLVIGAFYVFSGYAASVGFGGGHVAALVDDGNPFLTLASRYWGVTWILALTVLNSQFANLLSGCNAFVRVLFAMGREGILPRVLARTGRGVPQAALAGYMLFSLAYALGVGSQIGPLGVYGFAGTILGLGMVICYILMSVAVIRFYWRDYRAEFSMVRHGVFPVIGALLMLLPIYGLVWPTPAYPSDLVPWITIGWLLAGGAYLVVIHRRRRGLLAAMGRVFEDPESADIAVPQAAQEPA